MKHHPEITEDTGADINSTSATKSGPLGQQGCANCAELRRVNADLYDALWAILYADQDNQIDSELFQQAKAALDKAKGEL
jgi:hypothetical protein